MIKLNILNMEKFLQKVNQCEDTVMFLHPDGRKENLNKQYTVQKELLQKFKENKNSLRISLDIRNARDYMSIISYYTGDC